MVIVPIGADGQISIVNESGTTDVLVDVLGWFPVGPSFTGLTPVRLLDTRKPLPPPPVTPPPATSPPASNPVSPGDTKNCSDFATYAAAKAWFDTYYPYYGDIANLDQDGDRIPCESLPGAP